MTAMGLITDALYAEPTWSGYIGSGLLHMALWMALGSWEWGAVRHFQALLRRRQPDLFKVVSANHAEDPGVAICGYDEPASLWIANIFCFCHHGTGGLLMLVGVLTQQPWVWRHGLFTQLWGMDIADFVRIAWCKMFPPGPFPMRNGVKKPEMIGFCLFHHTVSLLGGLPGSVYMIDCKEFLWMGAFLAGAPTLLVGFDLSSRCVPPAFRRFHMFAGFMMFCIFAHQRIYLFFPMAWELSLVVYSSSMPWLARGSLFTSGIMMSFFNVMVTGFMGHGFFTKFIKARPEECSQDAPVGFIEPTGELGPTILSALSSSPTNKNKGSILKQRMFKREAAWEFVSAT